MPPLIAGEGLAGGRLAIRHRRRLRPLLPAKCARSRVRRPWRDRAPGRPTAAAASMSPKATVSMACTPMLAVTVMAWRSLRKGCSRRCWRRSSATCVAAARFNAGSTTTNSSPPKRAEQRVLVRPQGMAQRARRPAQALVADQVAVAVVDQLEVVQVDHQQRQRPAVLPRLSQQRLEPVAEVAAVVQSGQRIALAGFAQARVCILQLRKRAAQFGGALLDLVLQQVLGLAHDALVLVSQHGVALAKRDRQQQHLQRRTDLHAVLGEEVLGKHAEGDRREHGRSQQEHRPGHQEQARGRVLPAQHHDGDGDDPGHAQQHRRGGDRAISAGTAARSQTIASSAK